MRPRGLVAALAAWSLIGVASAQDDVILRAMTDEMARSKTLRLPGVDAPYYIEYALDDADIFTAVASLGAIVESSRTRARVPRVQVRVGSPEFDNTNYIFSDFFAGRGGGRLPLDNDYTTLRREFWLATDRAYKGAVESISRKRSALRNVTVQDKINDFTPGAALRVVEEPASVTVDEAGWKARVKSLSAVFAGFPLVLGSQVEYQAARGTAYLTNSDGAITRLADDLFAVRARGSVQAPDGMPLRDAIAFPARSPAGLPSETELRRQVEQVARNITALAAAPVAEDYSGPVLVEGVAAAQLLAQLLGSNLAVTRKPVMEPGRNVPWLSAELEGRIGSRILPEWIDAVDDPTQQSYRGQQLFGYYPVDIEGVAPKPVTLVEKGTLKSYLTTRQGVKGAAGSNGRARLPGPFGTKMATFGNLFIKASETTPAADLKKKLLALVEQRGKPYGMILRKLDYPSAASLDELRTQMAAATQRGGSRLVSAPVLAYRVYPDGREELVRGLRFRGVSSRSLKDIAVAGDDENIFHFINSGAPLAQMGSGGYVTGSTVVSPSVLFDDLELEKRTDDWPKLPVVPPPALSTQR